MNNTEEQPKTFPAKKSNKVVIIYKQEVQGRIFRRESEPFEYTGKMTRQELINKIISPDCELVLTSHFLHIVNDEYFMNESSIDKKVLIENTKEINS